MKSIQKPTKGIHDCDHSLLVSPT